MLTLLLLMQVNMEQAMLSQYRRLPGFHSEFVGLEVMGGHMDQIGFEDILNGGESSPFFLSFSVLFMAMPPLTVASLLADWGCTFCAERARPIKKHDRIHMHRHIHTHAHVHARTHACKCVCAQNENMHAQRKTLSHRSTCTSTFHVKAKQTRAHTHTWIYMGVCKWDSPHSSRLRQS